MIETISSTGNLSKLCVNKFGKCCTCAPCMWSHMAKCILYILIYLLSALDQPVKNTNAPLWIQIIKYATYVYFYKLSTVLYATASVYTTFGRESKIPNNGRHMRPCFIPGPFQISNIIYNIPQECKTMKDCLAGLWHYSKIPLMFYQSICPRGKWLSF